MQIKITGKHLDTGEALRSYVEEALEASINKYFERGAETAIIFSKQGHMFNADCSVHLDSGLHIKARGEGNDIYVSFDNALTKTEKQLRRYKRRLKNHHSKADKKVMHETAVTRILEAEPEDTELPEEWQPITIAEDNINVPELSVSEAVMQMELTHEDFLIFRNAGHGRLNIVHRRSDGNIGWIDQGENFSS